MSTRKIYNTILLCINLLLWIITFTMVSLVDKARPPFETFLNRLKDLPLRKTWNLSLMEYVYYLLILSIILSICSIILNIIAYRKEKIKFKLTPFFLGACSIYALVMYLMHF